MIAESKKSTVKNTKKNTDHLMPPWKKGQSGNPAGRPKKDRCVTDVMTELASAEKEGGSALRDVCKKVVEAARAGDEWAIKIMFDRIDGKPAQSLKIGVEDQPESEKPDAVLEEEIEDLKSMLRE